MELKANYDDFFIKAQRTRDAQADGGRSTRKGPKEARQEAWWQYRRDGYASVMAGEMAGQELGVHEATIRRAFDEVYPGLDHENGPKNRKSAKRRVGKKGVNK